MKTKMIIIGLVVIVSIVVAVGVFAAEDREHDVTNVKVNITEEQARKIAADFLQGGTIGKLELEDEDGVIVYGIEISDGQKIHDVKVDANTGKIIKDDTDQDEEKEGVENQSADEDDDEDVEHSEMNDKADDGDSGHGADFQQEDDNEDAD